MGKYTRVLLIIVVIIFTISLLGCSNSKRTSELEKTVADLQNKLSELQNATTITTEVTTAPETTQSEITQAEETTEETTAEKVGVIEKKIGDEIDMGIFKFTVNGSEEKTSLVGDFNNVTKPGEGAKFIVLNLTITNTTKEQFDFFPDHIFRIIDNQERQYTTFENSIGNVKNYLNVRTLKPSITEGGFLVYEVPQDADSYSLSSMEDENGNSVKVLLK